MSLVVLGTGVPVGVPAMFGTSVPVIVFGKALQQHVPRGVRDRCARGRACDGIMFGMDLGQGWRACDGINMFGMDPRTGMVCLGQAFHGVEYLRA
eukprot:1144448-Pelagomonas_calceolata.AAC.2